jgi:hypothetical protein
MVPPVSGEREEGGDEPAGVTPAGANSVNKIYRPWRVATSSNRRVSEFRKWVDRFR